VIRIFKYVRELGLEAVETRNGYVLDIRIIGVVPLIILVISLTHPEFLKRQNLGGHLITT
jgi:hypothetical protein